MTVQQITHTEAEMFQGPVPPPEMLARYEEICPGFAERTLKLVEQQATSRQGLESKVIQAKISHEAAGQWMAFILALAFLGVGAYALAIHEVGAGVGIWGVDIVGIIGMFIYRQVREEKRSKEGVPQLNVGS
jgi:uncharacterized membrane protein